MSDLISREALIEEIKQRAGMWQKTAEKFISVIKEQPTVEAKEVVHGKWIKNKQNPEAMQAFHELGIGKGMGINSIYWTCSKCGSWGTPTSNFCSNCGCDMRGENDAE
jgi:rubrerythrin